MARSLLLAAVIVGIVIFGIFFNAYDLIKIVFDVNLILDLITIFVIADSLLSLVIPIMLDRKALYSKRQGIGFSLAALWGAIFFSLIEIAQDASFNLVTPYITINNFFLQIGIGLWILGVFNLLYIVFQVLTLDLIRFNKTDLKFEYNQPTKWGISSINEELQKSQRVYFPIIILADENTRPWRLLESFVVSGLTYNRNYQDKDSVPSAIYFTFTRPAKEILDYLRDPKTGTLAKLGKGNDLIGNNVVNWKNLALIDCYSIGNERDNQDKDWPNDVKLFYADSNDPHHLNKEYEKALSYLKNDRKCTSVRVVYDAISDFLTFTDVQLATQYLRHNMGYEQRNYLETLYLFRKGTMEREREEYFLWFANGVLNMKRKVSGTSQYIDVDFRGPFDEPKRFKMDFKYSLIP